MVEKLLAFDPNLGILMISMGILLLIVGSLLLLLSLSSKEKVKSRAEGGFVVWIGPIPIVGGTDRTVALTLAILSAVIFIIFLVLIRFGV